MLSETLERVNRLRQQALANPDFLSSAQEHEDTLRQVEQKFEPKRWRRRVNKAKPHLKTRPLAELYEEVEFGYQPDTHQQEH